jgi:hypothetical protein
MTPNLAFLPSWREQIPIFMCYGQPEKFAQGAKTSTIVMQYEGHEERINASKLHALRVLRGGCSSRVPHSEHLNGRRS